MNPERRPTRRSPTPSQVGHVSLRSEGDCTDVAEHGAQVLRWFSKGRERLYLSPRAVFAPGHAIRGGIPVIFPQFSDRGPGLRHGFGRLRHWELQRGGSDPTQASFVLHDDADTRAHWPHAFHAELAVSISGGQLSVSLQVTNTGHEDFSFTTALHTYLRVDDLQSARLAGLEGRSYADSTSGGAKAVQDAPLLFEREVDRIYPDVSGPLLLADASGAVRVEQDGFRDVVVWNPGAELATRLGDLGANEHAHFVCVEAASVVAPVQLAPEATWQGRQVLTVLP